MSLATATKAIDKFQSSKIVPTFLGGEPLLEWDLITNVVEYAESKGINRFNIATNGLLLDNEKLSYMKKHNFTVQLSFDGIQQSQNSGRKTKAGRGSFDDILNSLDILLKSGTDFEIRMTLTPINVPYLSDSIDYLIDRGVTSRINIMPYIGVNWSTDTFAELDKQIKKILLKKNLPICINECINSEFANIEHLSDNTNCGCGSRVICVDYDEKIHSCFIPAGLEGEEFVIGDLDRGITKECGSENTYLSCPIWTKLHGEKAVNVYKKLYELWKND